MKELPLSQGLVTLLDDVDYEFFSQWKWYAKRIPRYRTPSFHAMRTAIIGGRQTTLTLHRVLMNCPKGMVVDHRNHETLDNRRENLRVCTHADNMRNIHPDSRCTRRRRSLHPDKYNGVFPSYCKKKPFRVKFKLNAKEVHLGHFATVELAAKAFDQKAFELGWIELLNFPEDFSLESPLKVLTTATKSV